MATLTKTAAPRAYERLENVDVSRITMDIGEPRKGEKRSGTIANVRYGPGDLKILLPSLRLPFGAKLWDANANKVAFALSFNEEDPEEKAAFNKLREIDERILTLAVENRRKLWPKTYTTAKEPKEAEMAKIREDIRAKVGASAEAKSGPDGQSYGVLLNVKIRRNNANPDVLDGVNHKQTGMQPLSVKMVETNEKVVVNMSNVFSILRPGSRMQPVIEASFFFVNAMGSANMVWRLQDNEDNYHIENPLAPQLKDDADENEDEDEDEDEEGEIDE